MTDEGSPEFQAAFDAALNNACSKCHENARLDYAKCLANAGDDENKKRACASALQNAVQACMNGPCRP